MPSQSENDEIAQTLASLLDLEKNSLSLEFAVSQAIRCAESLMTASEHQEHGKVFILRLLRLAEHEGDPEKFSRLLAEAKNEIRQIFSDE